MYAILLENKGQTEFILLMIQEFSFSDVTEYFNNYKV